MTNATSTLVEQLNINPKLSSCNSPYFNKDIFNEFNTEISANGRENISDKFKQKLNALSEETDFYECNEFEISALLGVPLWRLRDLRSANNNSYPFRKLHTRKQSQVKRDVGKVVYPLGDVRKKIFVSA